MKRPYGYKCNSDITSMLPVNQTPEKKRILTKMARTMQGKGATFSGEKQMISTALFPCLFTDAARIIGELSYTLCRPVYNDKMLLEEVSTSEGIEVNTLQQKLFSDDHQTHRRSMEKEILIDLLRQRFAGLLADTTDWIYYGFFSSLLESSDHLIQKILILADEKSRIRRATRQEKITEEIARKLIKEHDQKAACWTQFLFNKPPYSPDLYDTVIRYEGQDLLDVIAYIFMLQENQAQHDRSTSAPFFVEKA